MSDEKELSVREAGRLGGKKTAEKGYAFYAQIGSKGGKATKATHGSDFYRKIGSKGGEMVKAARK